MRKSLLATFSLVAGVAVGPQARAQWAVFDSSNFANTLQTMQTAANELTVLNSQLGQLRQTYQQISAMQTMFTSPSNVAGMFPGLNSSFMQNPMPAASAMPGQVFGAPATMSGNAQAFFNLNHAYTATGTDPQAAYLNRAPVSIANIMGIAATNLQSIEQRLANLTEMQRELQGATDIKQVASINGRIAIESNAIQGQQAQAQNLMAMANAQAQADQQSQLQTVRRGHEQAAAMFTSTLLP
jgi:type IV secretion system protein VirB5